MMLTSKMIWKKMTDIKNLKQDAAAAKSLQSCPTLCDPIDGSTKRQVKDNEKEEVISFY